MVGTYRIADLNIEIRSLYADVHSYCADYRTDGHADFAVTTAQADIDRERELSAREDERNKGPVRVFPDGYLEELAVYRKIAERMIDFGILLIHGSAVAVDGEAYLFTAKSGTGAVMVNDDKPLVRVTDGITVYGTPYNGKHRRGTNTAVRLKAVCILTRSAENRIGPVSPEEAYPFLLQQTYRPADAEKMKGALALLDRLVNGVRIYRLGCNMDPSAAEVAYTGMNENKNINI